MKRRVISVKSEQNSKMNYNNYNKNRRNKNSMTQEQITVRLMIRMMIIVEMIKMLIRLINPDDKNNDSYKNDDK